jgi:hypothetical protein
VQAVDFVCPGHLMAGELSNSTDIRYKVPHRPQGDGALWFGFYCLICSYYQRTRTRTSQQSSSSSLPGTLVLLPRRCAGAAAAEDGACRLYAQCGCVYFKTTRLRVRNLLRGFSSPPLGSLLYVTVIAIAITKKKKIALPPPRSPPATCHLLLSSSSSQRQEPEPS